MIRNGVRSDRANAHLDGATPSYFIQRSRLAGVVGAVEAMKTGVFA